MRKKVSYISRALCSQRLAAESNLLSDLRVIFASLSSAGLSEFSALARPLLDAIFSRDGSALSNIVVVGFSRSCYIELN